jgi:hypothetical protein
MSLQCGQFSLASKESGRSGKSALLWLRVLNSSILVVSTRPRKLCKISSMVSSGVGPASQLVCMLLIWMISSDWLVLNGAAESGSAMVVTKISTRFVNIFK